MAAGARTFLSLVDSRAVAALVVLAPARSSLYVAFVLAACAGWYEGQGSMQCTGAPEHEVLARWQTVFLRFAALLSTACVWQH